LEKLISAIPSRQHEFLTSILELNYENDFTKTYFPLPMEVNYVAQCLKTVAFTHEHAPKLQILAQLFTNTSLHSAIREKGGAYGAGASNSDGIFTFYSYRDPNTFTTLDNFKEAIELVINEDFSQKEVDEAILKTFSSIDTPKPPSKEGLVEFLTGLTDEMRQKYRDELINTNKNELVDVANIYFTLQPSSAIFGTQNYEQFKKRGSWTIYKLDNE